jgi:hypothetical protein
MQLCARQCTGIRWLVHCIVLLPIHLMPHSLLQHPLLHDQANPFHFSLPDVVWWDHFLYATKDQQYCVLNRIRPERLFYSSSMPTYLGQIITSSNVELSSVDPFSSIEQLTCNYCIFLYTSWNILYISMNCCTDQICQHSV